MTETTENGVRIINTDVLVAGYGASGGVSAITAKDSGADVIILEKMNHLGGCSVLAGGFMKAAKDVEKADRYLEITQGGRVDPVIVRSFAEGMKKLPDIVKKLAETDSAEIADRDETTIAAGYPFEGEETFYSVYVKNIPGFEGFSWANPESNINGQRLMKLLSDNVESRNIPVFYNASVKELITEDGRVTGAKALINGEEAIIHTSYGVILATGGFEFNEKLKKDYLAAIPVYGMGNPGNTGDGILMSQKVGAALWHMWLIHGSYGFKFDDCDTAIRTVLGGSRVDTRKVPWILLDKRGRRFMNEYHPAPQDTMHRPLEYYDPDLPGYPRIPALLVFDENGRKLGRIGNPLYASEEFKYEWSRDNSKEIEKGWIKKFETVEELAGFYHLDSDEVKKTLDKWNESVKEGADREYGRPSGTLVPIETGPFYATEVWPICTNTQGGPEHDAGQRVLDPYGEPIKGLYSVGELGAFWGHVYLLGGNLSECIISGDAAGRTIVSDNA